MFDYPNLTVYASLLFLSLPFATTKKIFKLKFNIKPVDGYNNLKKYVK